jgi:hypothetical protein
VGRRVYIPLPQPHLSHKISSKARSTCTSRDLAFNIAADSHNSQPPEAYVHVLFLSGRLVNNQLSGVSGSQIELTDFLFRPSNCLYRFNPYLVRLAAGFELRIELIVDISAFRRERSDKTSTFFIFFSFLNSSRFVQLPDSRPCI